MISLTSGHRLNSLQSKPAFVCSTRQSSTISSEPHLCPPLNTQPGTLATSHRVTLREDAGEGMGGTMATIEEEEFEYESRRKTSNGVWFDNCNYISSQVELRSIPLWQDDFSDAAPQVLRVPQHQRVRHALLRPDQAAGLGYGLFG